MSKQLMKDLNKLVNDKRIYLACGAYADKDTSGILIGVYFGVNKDYLGCFKMPCEDSFDYTYFIECLRYIQSVHPTRTNESVLVRMKVDSNKKPRFKVTTQSDYEFYSGTTYTNMSDELNSLINEAMLERGIELTKVFDASYDRYIATYDYCYTQDFII